MTLRSAGFGIFNALMVLIIHDNDLCLLTGGVCVRATDDNSSHLQDVRDGGAGGQPALQVHRRS